MTHARKLMTTPSQATHDCSKNSFRRRYKNKIHEVQMFLGRCNGVLHFQESPHLVHQGSKYNVTPQTSPRRLEPRGHLIILGKIQWCLSLLVQLFYLFVILMEQGYCSNKYLMTVRDAFSERTWMCKGRHLSLTLSSCCQGTCPPSTWLSQGMRS